MADRVVREPQGAESTGEIAGRWRHRRMRRLMAVVALCLAVVWPLRWAAATFVHDCARRALAARDSERALAWLDRGERWFGADAESCFLRARAERKRGDWNALLTNLRRAHDLGVSPARIEREQWLAQAQSGQLRSVEGRLPRLLADPGEDGAEICEAFVNGYFLNHRLAEAGRLLDAWIADYPLDPEPLYIRGKIRSESQFYRDAENDFRTALSRDPNYWPAALELADTLRLQREFEPALVEYRRIAVVPAAALRARLGEITCLRLLERRDEARGAAERALAAAPYSREALLELGLIELDDDRYSEAAVLLKKALEINPRALVVRQSLARALRGSGDQAGAQEHAAYVEQAQIALRRADELCDRVARNPDDAASRYEIGKIYLQFGVPERGVNWLKSVINCDPNHAPAQQALDEYFAQIPAPRGGEPRNP